MGRTLKEVLDALPNERRQRIEARARQLLKKRGNEQSTVEYGSGEPDTRSPTE